MSKTRRNKRGRYARSWWSHFYPLIVLIISIVLGILLQAWFAEQDIIGPCRDGCTFNFSVRAYEEVAVTNAGQTASSELQTVLPVTGDQEIIDYIRSVFKEDADSAFMVLSCENGRLRPDAENWNRNGTWDAGIFQINEIHGKSISEMKDWKKNIDYAYKIFKRQGWSPWSCSYKVGVTPFYLR